MSGNLVEMLIDMKLDLDILASDGSLHHLPATHMVRSTCMCKSLFRR